MKYVSEGALGGPEGQTRAMTIVKKKLDANQFNLRIRWWPSIA